MSSTSYIVVVPLLEKNKTTLLLPSHTRKEEDKKMDVKTEIKITRRIINI